MSLRRVLTVLVAALAVCHLAVAADAPSSGRIYAVTFTTGPGWDAAKPPQEQKFMREHSANLARLRTQGVSILGGRYADKGLLLVRAADETAVRAELAQDPAVAAGTFQVAVDEYRPFQHGDTRPPPAAADAKATPQLKQWVYVLRLIPRLHPDSAWTDADKAAVGRHFAHLQAATKAGQVIHAGRTMEPGEKTFGVVIIEADDEPAARTVMNSDPAVVAGIMTAELHPYAIALQRK